MTNKLLDNLETDINLCKKENYHINCHNLLEMLMSEDIPELIKFARKVNEVLDKEIGPTSGDYMSGFKEGIQQVKRSIYE